MPGALPACCKNKRGKGVPTGAGQRREIDSFVLKVCVKDGVCSGWKVGRGVPYGLAAFPERGLNLLWLVEPGALCVAHSAKRL